MDSLTVGTKSAPKLLPLDIGLANHQMGSFIGHYKSMPHSQLLDGKTADMFVGLQLLASSQREQKLHFWVAESSKANAELDYLISSSGKLLPIEVKAGATGTLKSLHQFLYRSKLDFGIRLHTGAFEDRRYQVKMAGGILDYRLLSIPLYLAEHISNIISSRI
ncbi:MAG: DUF4143 domain-containing protein [Deltaproteobacteria bacterium]|nr:DUF4143 domain-containing protein [Deltaproteobacteria bacterium]